MNNASRNAQTRRLRCYENNCPFMRPNPNGTRRMVPTDERNACLRTCLEEFPYTPYELEQRRRREAYLQATQEAQAAANAAAARASAQAPGRTPGGGKNRKSRKTRRRSIRR